MPSPKTPQQIRRSTTDERALAFAHDIRKFEIELYWKRATYFWTLIAASIGGFVLLLNTEEAKLDVLARQLRPVLLQAMASIAFLFSIGWFVVNKGSKFWQRNWEAHVDLLEGRVTGHLYKRVAYKVDDSPWMPIYTYAFSPTATNQLLSFFVMVLTFGLCLLPLPWSLEITFLNLDPWRTAQLGVFLFTLVAALSILKYARNAGIYKDGEQHVQELRFHRRETTTLD
jgi:hypothetical protein